MKVLYTAKATATGGRSGYVKSDNGILDLHVNHLKQWAALMMITQIRSNYLQLVTLLVLTVR